MIRPPPLQLKYDNRFPFPVRTPSKSKSASFAAQLYKANWKNAVIAVAGLNGLRYSFAIYNAIVDASVDDEEGFDGLFQVSLALAVIYLTAFLIEVYGVVSVSLQRLKLIRGYLYLALLCSTLITATGVLQGVSYFLFAEDIILECASLAMHGRGYEKSLFRSRPWPNTVFRLTKVQARKHCTYAWVHQSWTQIASVFLFSLIPSVVYYLVVYTYYRQTTDPHHPANLQHTHSPRTRTRTQRQRTQGAAGGVGAGRGREQRSQAVYPNVGYSRLANPSTTDVWIDQGMTSSRLQAVPGPSQLSSRRQTTNANANAAAATSSSHPTKGIKRSRRPPPLIPSPSPLGLNDTPGAPAYECVPPRGRSRVYAAFAAPVGSAEYDKFV